MGFLQVWLWGKKESVGSKVLPNLDEESREQFVRGLRPLTLEQGGKVVGDEKGMEGFYVLFEGSAVLLRKPAEQEKNIKALFKKNAQMQEEVRALWLKYKATWTASEIESDEMLVDILSRYTIDRFNVGIFVQNLARDVGLISAHLPIFDILKKNKNQCVA